MARLTPFVPRWSALIKRIKCLDGEQRMDVQRRTIGRISLRTCPGLAGEQIHRAPSTILPVSGMVSSLTLLPSLMALPLA